jgi:hypothetical protein
MRFQTILAADTFQLAMRAKSGHAEAAAISRAIVRQSGEPCIACGSKIGRHNSIAGWFLMYESADVGAAFAIKCVCVSCAAEAGGIAEAILKLARSEP